MNQDQEKETKFIREAVRLCFENNVDPCDLNVALFFRQQFLIGNTPEMAVKLYKQQLDCDQTRTVH